MATSFFNDKNRNIARDLAELIVEANQELPDWLEKVANDNRYGVRGGGGAYFRLPPQPRFTRLQEVSVAVVAAIASVAAIIVSSRALPAAAWVAVRVSAIRMASMAVACPRPLRIGTAVSRCASAPARRLADSIVRQRRRLLLRLTRRLAPTASSLKLTLVI